MIQGLSFASRGLSRAGRGRIAALLLALVTASSVSAGVESQHLRFAQITDMHLFDAGYKCFAPDVQKEYSENLAALEWAIDAINAANLAKPIDFVVVTGDLGIENLAQPNEAERKLPKPTASGCDPLTALSDDYGPVPSITVDQAAGAATGLLGKLEVTAIFLVPGNNDLRDENPADLSRYQAFVRSLAAKMPGRIRDLTNESNALPGSDTVVNGYRLIGLNSASFKPTADELKSGPATGSDPIVDCVDSHPTSDLSIARQTELERVGWLVAKSTAPTLLFTHVPDLPDPYSKRQKNDSQTCRFPSAWLLNSKAIATWQSIVALGHVVGTFAGHFHSSLPTLYGRAGTNAVGHAGDVYVAPPLSIRLQWTTDDPQRGFVVVDVDGQTVKPYLHPYQTLKCCERASYPVKHSTSGFPLNTKVLATAIATMLLAAIFYLGARASQTDAAMPRRWAFALIDADTNTYSLTKLQFYAWTWLTVFSYSYLTLAQLVLQRQFTIPDVPTSLANLFGISAGTTVAGLVASAAGKSNGGGIFPPRISDFITSGGEVASDRAQFLLWNVVAVGAYYLKVIETDPCVVQMLPEVPGNLLLLSGISSGGYLLGRFARNSGPILADAVISPAPADAANAAGDPTLKINGSGLQDGFRLQFKQNGDGTYTPLNVGEALTQTISDTGNGRITTLSFALNAASLQLLGKGGMLRVLNPDGRFAEHPLDPPGKTP